MSIEKPEDLEGLARVGKVVAATLRAMADSLRPGLTTAALDSVGEQILNRHGARSAPRVIYGFPGVNLISVNDEVVHGVPGDRVLERGDIVSLDVTAELDGYVADAAISIPIPPVPQRLSDCASVPARPSIRPSPSLARANQ